MQKFLLAATAVASIALFAPMSAVEGQSNNEPAVAPAPRTVNLTAEQRFIIKEIVLKDLNVPKARAGAPESIGDPVPSNVELHDMTPELARKVPEAKSHQFYVTADAIVLVSRSDRKIADVTVDWQSRPHSALGPFLAAELGYWSGYKQLQSVFFL